MSKYNEVMKKVVVTDEMRSRILENIDKELKEGSVETTATDENDKITDISSAKKNRENVNNIVSFIVKYGSRVAVFALVLLGAFSVIRFVGMNNHSNMESATSFSEEATMTAEESYDSTDEAFEMEAEATEDTNMTESYGESVAAPAADMEEFAEAESSDYLIEEASEDMAASEPSMGLDTDREKAISTQKNELTADLGSVKKAEFVSAIGFDFTEPAGLVKAAEEINYYPGQDGGEIRYVTKDDILYFYISLNPSFTDEYILSEAVFASTYSCTRGDKAVTMYGNDNVYNVATWNADNICYAIVSDKGMTEENIRSWLD